ncbi:hypothetical protein ACH46N_21800 [Streptomyces pristinaespiralis]|uniref:Uncharacterized protein n=2 Tax=Streptomyces pristinaespiralis TaxID=38300 RepID=B5HB08_STRE2|nr:hypothetical protein [Streptomyces pristinaespiralis]ALC18329.1 LigA protein [Streptomyces pristinaespiralis]ALC25636.1 LigA protein [Streptomyces pristinaespiralis]EDY64019.1 conserved hypothetical protein [Streptomyces pristinaespiralis ATCC 25486]QMU12190.1 hypothetical protein H3L99_00095 [Streptomyces pristinaespiralis]
MTTPPTSDPSRGIVGDRQLIAVQAFDIARLTAHAVPIVPETFIAVSGLGPKDDSNGSGKTSFLIAVSLLLADPQWRLETNGGRHASGILFRPDAAGVDQAHQASPVTHGYIVGVFAHPDEPAANPLTVWVRIATTTPYLQANWTEGLHVADAPTDHERSIQADALWRELGTRQLLSARAMAEKLYGTAPRCLTYLDTPLRPPVPSLLSQQLTEMEPHDIGRSLIALSGMTPLLEEEDDLRGQALQHRISLEKAQTEHTQALLAEEQVMSGVRARETARLALQRGHEAWHRYLAASYRDAHHSDQRVAALMEEERQAAETAAVLVQDAEDRLNLLGSAEELATQRGAAHQAWSDARQLVGELSRKMTELTTQQAMLRSRRATLLPAAQGWDGSNFTATAARLEQRQREHAKAELQCDEAKIAVTRARTHLHDVEQGRSGQAGRAIDLLGEHRIRAHGLLDQLNVDEAARPEWEPRLAPWQDAIVVEPEHEDTARRLLHAALPGAQIISSDTGQKALPEGIHSTLNVTRFLATLQQRLIPSSDGLAVRDQALALTVTGGFPNTLAGREAQLRQARADLAAAKHACTAATEAMSAATAALTLAQTLHAAAQAAEELAHLGTQENDLQTKIDNLAGRSANAARDEQELQQVWQDAVARHASHKQLLTSAKLTLEGASKALKERQRNLAALERQREQVAASQWQQQWGATLEDATRLLDQASDQTRSSRPAALRRQSEDQLRRAYEHYGVDGTPGADVSQDLRTGQEMMQSFADTDPAGLPSLTFADVAAPLDNRLAGHRDQDEVAAARITHDQHARQQAIAELTDGVATSTRNLKTLQDMIEKHLDGLFAQISVAFHDLDLRSDGHGAKLEHISVRPQGAGDWQWQVIPRWKRSRSGGYVSYRENANSAQVKVHAILLVLAALLADSHTQGRVLILDELGNSLGEVNRKDMLAALRDVARDQHLTILGTCQDSVLADAADVCGELLWFVHASAADIINQPTSAWAFDSNGARTQLTEDWITAGRAHA